MVRKYTSQSVPNIEACYYIISTSLACPKFQEITCYRMLWCICHSGLISQPLGLPQHKSVVSLLQECTKSPPAHSFLIRPDSSRYFFTAPRIHGLCAALAQLEQLTLAADLGDGGYPIQHCLRSMWYCKFWSLGDFAGCSSIVCIKIQTR